jgi:hypothetical protein
VNASVAFLGLSHTIVGRLVVENSIPELICVLSSEPYGDNEFRLEFWDICPLGLRSEALRRKARTTELKNGKKWLAAVINGPHHVLAWVILGLNCATWSNPTQLKAPETTMSYVLPSSARSIPLPDFTARCLHVVTTPNP